MYNSLDFNAIQFIIVRMKRIQKNRILHDLAKKMVFIVGPRQAGKSWLAADVAEEFKHKSYLSYDSYEDRKIIKKQAWLPSTELLILDELHKMPKWKNYLKGIYDTKSKNLKIIVTGSARLSAFSKAGDSLAGRYFTHHLFPLSPAELKQLSMPVDLNKLITRSGFPEPYLASNDIDADRWRMQYINSLITIDVLDFDKIHNLKAMQTVFDLLRYKVGSPVSIKTIAEDVAISPNTVKKYIQVLEDLYIVFRVTPYSKNIARSILKEPKIYFFDTGLVQGDNGAKFENFAAGCLLKHVYAKRDYEAKNYRLQYLRTKEKQEVDFALVCDDKIEQIIETKYANHEVNKALIYFQGKYQLSAKQVVQELLREYQYKDIEIVSAKNYLEDLFL